MMDHKPNHGEIVKFPNHGDLQTPCICQVCRSYVEQTHISSILNRVFKQAEAVNER